MQSRRRRGQPRCWRQLCHFSDDCVAVLPLAFGCAKIHEVNKEPFGNQPFSAFPRFLCLFPPGSLNQHLEIPESLFGEGHFRQMSADLLEPLCLNSFLRHSKRGELERFQESCTVCCNWATEKRTDFINIS